MLITTHQCGAATVNALERTEGIAIAHGKFRLVIAVVEETIGFASHSLTKTTVGEEECVDQQIQ